MRMSQNFIAKRIRLLLLCGVLLVRFHAGAEQISLARAIELSKHHAGSVGSTGNGGSGCRPEHVVMLRVPDTSDQSDFDCQSLPGGILERAGCQTLLQSRWTISNSETGCVTMDRSGGSDEVVTNTAMEYIRLVWASAQLSAREQQHELARRLVVIERMRARAGVDDDVVLYRAKLLEAQTRMRAAAAEADVLGLRRALAAQIEVPEKSLEIVPDSVPALPTIEDHNDSGQSAASHDQFALLTTEVKEVTAARDAAQLAYYLAYREATRMSASSTASLGDQLTTRIRDAEKFDILLSEIVELQQHELILLAATGGVEGWASSAPLTRESLVSEHRTAPTRQEAPPEEGIGWEGKATVQGVNAPLAKSVTPSSKGTIMVLPADGTLTVRNCKQFAAVGIVDGAGKDITSVAKWSSSNESVAIVSTSGLVTAIGEGKAAISVDLDGLSRTVYITVVDSRGQ